MKRLAATVTAVLAFPTFAAAAPQAAPDPTCDPARLDPESYRLTTRAQALNLLEPRYSWWDGFNLGKHADDLGDLNDVATRLAERALELDASNLMALSILARQYLIVDEPERAVEAWARTLRAGGAVVWSSTLYDVDARTFHFLAFDRDHLRVYTMQTLNRGPVVRQFYGLPKFPEARNERFYAAMAGCLDASLVPEAVVPWREIKAGNWVLWFKLDRPITVRSDRTGKTKKLDQIKVNLHGRTGELEVYKPVGSDQLGMRGRGPAAYNDLVRRTLVKFVDPDKRMKLPKLSPGAGW
jgi:hypothetical protein